MIDLALRSSPLAIAKRIGINLYDWQREIILSENKEIVVCGSRQGGKNVGATIRQAWKLLTQDGYMLALIAKNFDQTKKQVERIDEVMSLLGFPIKYKIDNVTRLVFENGSEVKAFPHNLGTVRGFSRMKKSFDELFIDEASFVSDDLIASARPSVAAGNGTIMMNGTAFGKMGIYFEAIDKSLTAHKLIIHWSRVPHYTQEFLRRERETLGDRWFRQEYECEFLDPIDALFTKDLVDRAFSRDIPALQV